MLKNISQLEYIIDGKLYHFTGDADSPLPKVKEALVKFLHFIGQIEDQIAAGQKELEDKQKSESMKTDSIIEELPKEG